MSSNRWRQQCVYDLLNRAEARKKQPRRRQPGIRPLVEVLEDRTLPSVMQLTSGTADHRWPALNNDGDVVYSSQDGSGFWQVFRLDAGASTAVQLTSGANNHQYPVIADNDDVIYFQDGGSNGIGWQVLRQSASGSQSQVEFSSSNAFSGAHRDANMYSGIASDGTSVTGYNFFDSSFDSTPTRRFNVSGVGRLDFDFGGSFSSYNYPDINVGGDLVYSGDGFFNSGSIYKTTTLGAFPGTVIASGSLARINDSGDLVTVTGNLDTAGNIQLLTGPSYSQVTAIGNGSWADINNGKEVVFEKLDVNGTRQIFLFDPGPDLIAKSVRWDGAQSGITFKYEVKQEDVLDNTSVALYWSPTPQFDPNTAQLVPASLITIDQPGEKQVGEHGPFFVSHSDLFNALTPTIPASSTYLLLVVDPWSATQPDGIVGELDNSNNELSYELVTQRFPSTPAYQVPDYSMPKGADIDTNGTSDWHYETVLQDDVGNRVDIWAMDPDGRQNSGTQSDPFDEYFAIIFNQQYLIGKCPYEGGVNDGSITYWGDGDGNGIVDGIYRVRWVSEDKGQIDDQGFGIWPPDLKSLTGADRILFNYLVPEHRLAVGVFGASGNLEKSVSGPPDGPGGSWLFNGLHVPEPTYTGDPMSIVNIIGNGPSVTSLDICCDPLDLRNPVTVSGSFTNPDSLAVHTVYVDWGDGGIDQILLPSGTNVFSATHQYSLSGSTNPILLTAVVAVQSDSGEQDLASVSFTPVVNNSPLARDDVGVGFTTTEDTPLITNNVLDNDTASDPSGGTSTGFELLTSTFFGGSGNQLGTDVTIQQGNLYVSGRGSDSSGHSIALSYQIPSDAASAPTFRWQTNWPPPGFSPAGQENFNAVVASADGVYFPGWSHRQTSDGVGDKENKTVVVKFDPSGPIGADVGGAEWVARANFFPYRGGEGYRDGLLVDDGSGPALYVAGGGEEIGFGGGRTLLAKIDPVTGDTVWRRKYATDPAGNNIAGTFQRISSSGNGLAWLNGFAYIAGHDRDASQVGGTAAQGMLLKYDAASQTPDSNPNSDGASVLNPVWARHTGFNAFFNDVTASSDSLYVAGFAFTPGTPNSADYLVQKYDESGNLVWSRTFGGASDDVLNKIISVGDRLFVVGYTTSEGAGGQDAVLMEIDPSTGDVLETELFGGSQNDLAHGLIANGDELYIVGESQSFAGAGNSVGESDLTLLRYKMPALAGSGQLIVQSIDTTGTIGLVTNNGDGTFNYDPNGQFEFLAVNESASDTFDYTVSDQNGNTDTATVTISVTGVNDSPQIVSLSTNTSQSQRAKIQEVVTLNGSFVDVDLSDTHQATIDWGDGSTSPGIVSQTTGGGTVSATHAYSQEGNYTVTLTLRDSHDASSSQSTTAFVGPGVFLAGGTLFVVGTDAQDYISMWQVGNTIYVSASLFRYTPNIINVFRSFDASLVNDINVKTFDAADYVFIQRTITKVADVEAGGGPDGLFLGGGNNNVDGGPGNDRITTYEGNDTITDPEGDNTFVTGAGNDRVTTGTGNDYIDTGAGMDTINAGDGNNTVKGGIDNDVVTTGTGNDVITNSGGDDTINAGEGDNVVEGSSGVDIVTTGSGNDRIYTYGGNDIIVAGGGNNLIDTGDGHDQVTTGAGNDVISAGAGNDLVRAGAGTDEIQGGSGNDILLGEGGADTLRVAGGRNILIGGTGADFLAGLTGSDLLIAGTTGFDADNAALNNILSEWSSTRSYTDRVTNIRNGSGVILGGAGVQLSAGLTVHDDGEVDTLTGSAGLDWFFASLADVLTDRLDPDEEVYVLT